MFQMISDLVPIKFGILPLVDPYLNQDKELGEDWKVKVLYFLNMVYGKKASMSFLNGLSQHYKDKHKQNDIKELLIEVLKQFKPKPGKKEISLQDLIQYKFPKVVNQLYDSSKLKSKNFSLSLPEKHSSIYMNGHRLPFSNNFKNMILDIMYRYISQIQKLLYFGQLSDSSFAEGVDLYDVLFMRRKGVLKEWCLYLKERGVYLDVLGEGLGVQDLEGVHYERAGVTVEETEAEAEGEEAVGEGYLVWLVVNPELDSSLQLLNEFFSYLKQSPYSNLIRYSVILTNSTTKEQYQIYQQQSYTTNTSRLYQLVVNKFGGRNGMVVNGRVFGPFREGFYFSKDQYIELFKSLKGDIKEQRKFVSITATADTDTTTADTDTGSKNSSSKSDLLNQYIMVKCSLLNQQKIYEQYKILHPDTQHSPTGSTVSTVGRYTFPSFTNEPHITYTPAHTTTSDTTTTTSTTTDTQIEISLLIDPLDKQIQKISSILEVLIESQLVSVRVWFFHRVLEEGEYRGMDIYKTYYRFHFGSGTRSSMKGSSNGLWFNDLPTNTLLTMNFEFLDGVVVMPTYSLYDLDNFIFLSTDTSSSSDSRIVELGIKSFLVEGHAVTTQGRIPRGVQLELRPINTTGTTGISGNMSKSDTIIMQNLGYFQLKAKPGVWFLCLRPGRSQTMYHLLSYDGVNSRDKKCLRVVVVDWKGAIGDLRLEQVEEGDILTAADSGSADSGSGSLWQSLFGTGSSSTGTNEVLNIFSVASGHLYERLMRIMFLSVLKHTTSKVKFWIIEDFLSPLFKSTLPHLSQQLGFEYELVTYHWPQWLHPQKEKQRRIWAYKILYLDVLFPLSLHRIIFVDADQIVRTDLMELQKMDINNAPYAYTPFCEDREDMKGFRFWETGYWQQTLKPFGRRYHISALYLIDLKRFRQLAAGDILRHKYHLLSQDPNSLSNLDQDLPNDLQGEVPIFSLDQEWVYCETWCRKEGLGRAKTIDLCNDPKTKEPKLERAMRMIPEWRGYDEEIRGILSSGVSSDEVKHDEL